MNYQWRKSAERQLKKDVEYCIRMFGTKVALQFVNSIDRQVLLLAANPHIGIVEPLLTQRRHEYRSLVVHEHYKLVYYIKEDTLYIVDLWDTRREPKGLAHRIRT